MFFYALVLIAGVANYYKRPLFSLYKRNCVCAVTKFCTRKKTFPNICG